VQPRIHVITLAVSELARALAFYRDGLGHAVGSKEAVDAVLAQVAAAGATMADRPHDRPWGIYSGYFRDLDGHLWEILWNPELDGI